MVLQVLDLVATSAASEPFYGDCPTSYTNLDVNTTAQPTCTVIPQGKKYFKLFFIQISSFSCPPKIQRKDTCLVLSKNDSCYQSVKTQSLY